MAINRYTTSSRFADTTTIPVKNLPEVTVKGNGETVKERNDRKYREYQAQVADRDKLVAAENKRVSSTQKDIETYDKFIENFNKANPGQNFEKLQRAKKDFGLFAGGGKLVGSKGLARYNEMQRKDNFPVATKLYRPGAFASDDEFLDTMDFDLNKGRGRGSIAHEDIRRPSEYKPKTYPEIAFPDLEEDLDRMELMPADLKTRRQRARDIEIVGMSGPEYSDPLKPSRGKRDVFKGDRIKYAQKATRDNNTGTKGLGYKREERLAKATYGRGLEGTNLEGLSERKDDAKYERRRALATGNIRAAMDAGRELRDLRKAERYRKAAMGEGGAAREGKIDRPGALKYFTPESMQGFRDSKDNPLNRNRRS